jgi:protein kinase-like protein
MTAPPLAIPGQRVVGEPRRLRHEIAWPIELPDGRRALLAQLVPELAADLALRRRWVVDMERIAALPVARLAPTVAIGPAPDPRAPDAAPPWRVRLDPDGESLDALLRRAPLPDDEVIALGRELADALHSLHAAGAVLRDLDPRTIVLAADGRAWFTDIGHARLAILSSRTASSLLLESSPYVAPEALLGTVVDARADVYSLGVVLWRAMTGGVPFEASLVTARTTVPDLAALRRGAPRALVALVTRCVAHEPEHRPPTARDIGDALRGTSTDTAITLARTTCQACGADMTAGLRLCLRCGKQAVQFHRAAPGDPDAVAIELHKATEEADFLAKLGAFYTTVATHVPRLNFVVGDRRMYSKAELAQRHALPTVLVADLAPETSQALVERLRGDGFKVRTTTPRQLEQRRRSGARLAFAGLAGVVGWIALLAAGLHGLPAGLVLCAAIFATVFGTASNRRAVRSAKRLPLGELRATPAMLPAADAQVAAVAAALTATRSPDVRTRLEELAILVQRLCDADHTLAGTGTARAPIANLVELAAQTAAAVDAIDTQLATLDEGAIVRALARSEARREAPALRVDLLAGLDTLRQLEDQRAVLLGRLLEIASLARTAVQRDLAAAAAITSDDIEVARAFESLRDPAK